MEYRFVSFADKKRNPRFNFEMEDALSEFALDVIRWQRDFNIAEIYARKSESEIIAEEEFDAELDDIERCYEFDHRKPYSKRAMRRKATEHAKIKHKRSHALKNCSKRNFDKWEYEFNSEKRGVKHGCYDVPDLVKCDYEILFDEGRELDILDEIYEGWDLLDAYRMREELMKELEIYERKISEIKAKLALL